MKQTNIISRRKFVLGAGVGMALTACAAPLNTLTVKAPEVQSRLPVLPVGSRVIPQSTDARSVNAPSVNVPYVTTNASQAIVRAKQADAAEWEGRWVALSAAIDALRETLQPEMPRYTVLAITLDQLQAFGEQQFQHFYALLKQGAVAPEGYSQLHGLYKTLDEVAFDLQIIERAVYERLVGSPSIKASLNALDPIIAASLQPAIDAGLFAHTGVTPTVITYFMKSASIRVIPYAAVALVGIPYSCADLIKKGETNHGSISRDLLAIPHEVGHFVYWHGWVGQGTAAMRIADALPEIVRKRYGTDFPKWMLPWLEECFADVYGCLVAGPLTALHFQDMALTHTRDEMITDDGDHPVHAMRSDLFIQVLRNKMGLGQWADALQARWVALRDDHLKLRGGHDRMDAFVPALNESPTFMMAVGATELQKRLMPVPLAESSKFSMVIEALDEVIGLIRAHTTTPTPNWWRAAYDHPGVRPTTPDAVAAQLYSRFDQHARGTHVSLKSLPALDQSVVQQTVPFKQSFAAIAPITIHSDSAALQKANWFSILNAAGWTTEGPQSPQSGGP